MAEKGLSEMEAAKEICGDAAWEWRRQQTVAEQRDLGGTPALTAVSLAKRRARANPELAAKVGFKSGLSTTQQGDASREPRQPTLGQGGSRVTIGGSTILDDAPGPTRTETQQPRRVWNRNELDTLRQTNPAAYRQAIKDIASNMDDAGTPLIPLSNFVNLRR